MDEIAVLLHGGQVPNVVVRLAEEAATGELIGFCGFQTRPLPLLPRYPNAPYITVIGLSGAFRGCRLPDGSRLGGVLLGDALGQIYSSWNAPPMPPVWALVAPANTTSHSLFADYGFGHISTGGPYDVRLRPPGLGLSRSP